MMQDVISRVRRWPPSNNILVLIAYALLTLIMTWPVIGRLGTHIPGSEGDAWEHLWTARWMRDAILGGQSIFYTDLIFYPQGTLLTSHNIAWANIAMWLPLQIAVGEATAYSLMMLAVYVLNGFAVFLLAKELIRSQAAAFVAGLIGAFWPFILSHHNSPNLSLIAFVPLAMLYLKRTLERQRIREALLAALFVALIGIARWQMLVLSGVLIGLFFVCLLLNHREYRTRRAAGLTLLALAVAALIMLPLLLPPALDQITRVNADEIFTSDGSQSDLLAYLVPNRFHPWWGQAVFERFYGNFGINQFSVAFIGYMVVILAVIGMVKRWRKARFWLLVTSVYVLLALGPALLVNGRVVLPLPYSWLDDLFLFRIIRDPDRFNAILVIPVAMLAGLGVVAIREGFRLSRRRSTLIIAVVTIFILFEYAVRYPTYAMAVPEWYYQLAQEEDDFAILDLPMQTRVHDEHYMHYQFEHGKPLVGGKISRPPAEAYAFINSVPFLRSVRKDPAPPEDIVRFSEQFALLEQAGVRYLILHKNRLGEQQLAAWRAWLGLAPLHEDEELVVYQTAWQLGRDLTTKPTGLPGLAIVSTGYGPETTTQDGWVTVDIRWASDTGLDQDYAICFEIGRQVDKPEIKTCLPLSPEWSTVNWQANEVVDTSYSLNFDPFLESGKYTITAEIVSEAGKEPVSLPLPVGEVAFTAVDRHFASNNEVALDDWLATFGKDIALTEFETRELDNNTVEVSVGWLALNRMDQSYKVFLHLINPVTGNVVSQVDMAPRNWSYPTTWWEQNEIVTDSLQLALESVPSGEYDLFIGLYDEATGERLPVTMQSDTSGPQDSLLLTRIVR